MDWTQAIYAAYMQHCFKYSDDCLNTCGLTTCFFSSQHPFPPQSRNKNAGGFYSLAAPNDIVFAGFTRGLPIMVSKILPCISAANSTAYAFYYYDFSNTSTAFLDGAYAGPFIINLTQS